MAWTEKLSEAVIWMEDTGTAAIHVDLYRVGPMFKVEYRDYKHAILSADVESRWYFRYDSALTEYNCQCLLAQEYAYGD